MLSRIAQYPRSVHLSRNAWILLGATAAVVTAAGLAIVLNPDLRDRLFQAQSEPEVTTTVDEGMQQAAAVEVTQPGEAQTSAPSEGGITAEAGGAPSETGGEPAAESGGAPSETGGEPAADAGVGLQEAIQVLTEGLQSLGINIDSTTAPSMSAGSTQ